MSSHNYKKAILYSQRIMEENCNVAEIEDDIIKHLHEKNFEVVKKFSDLGYQNRMRTGLNELIKYLMNTDQTIDLVAFYSFDYLGRDKARLNYVMPRIKKYVTRVMLIENQPSLYRNGKLKLQFNQDIWEKVI
ncbi:recombinase family protein [Oceanobacillus profundus]|nr:recombinase family protein [Oceanobacillus profundus]